MASKEAFIKFTEYLVDVFNQKLGKNLAKDYFYNKDIDFQINGFSLSKVLKDLERLEKQDKILEILEPYTELEYDNVNDEYNLIIDASERIPLSEDYDINRVILGIDDYEVMPIKEWLENDK